VLAGGIALDLAMVEQMTVDLAFRLAIGPGSTMAAATAFRSRLDASGEGS